MSHQKGRSVANHQAIGRVAEAVSRLLAGREPQFAVYHAKDSASPMAAGISVFVYQVVVDPVQRNLPPAVPHHKRPLPVRVWLLLTAWAKDASSEHALLGWAMRAIADHPNLSSGFLN